MNDQNPNIGKASAETRGKRLKWLRKMADLTRQNLFERYGIKVTTQRSWEQGCATGLTEQGARRIITALQKEGLNCSISWLLYGKGPAPTIYTDISATMTPATQDTAITAELTYFLETHVNSTYFLINDDGMEPPFFLNNTIAGIQRFGNEIDTLLGLTCIVETESGQRLFRLIKKGSGKYQYHLCCTNINTSVKMPILYDTKLISAAPVIWHRKKDTY